MSLLLRMVIVMPEELDLNKLNLIGAEITALGDVIDIFIAEDAYNGENEDASEIAKLEVLGALLVLIGDTITLISVLVQNEESDKARKGIESPDTLEEQVQRLETISSWLDLVSDVIALRGSLLAQLQTNK